MQQRLKLLLLLFISISTMGQYKDGPVRGGDSGKAALENLTFGFKITPSVTWVKINHNDAIADGAALNLGLGITAEYEVNSVLSVVSAISYNTFGGYAFDSLSLNTENIQNNYNLKYGQIEIPLGIKLQTNGLGKTSYYLQGGLLTGFILSAKEKYKSSVANTTVPDNDIMRVTNPSMAGFFAGVGAKYKITNKLKLFAEINFKNILTSVADGNKYVEKGIHEYNEPIKIFPAAMDFSFGLQF